MQANIVEMLEGDTEPIRVEREVFEIEKRAGRLIGIAVGVAVLASPLLGAWVGIQLKDQSVSDHLARHDGQIKENTTAISTLNTKVDQNQAAVMTQISTNHQEVMDKLNSNERKMSSVLTKLWPNSGPPQ